MGFFQHRLGRAPRPTVVNDVKDEEKHPPQTDGADSIGATRIATAFKSPHLGTNPAAERAVIRKLDRRVPILLGVLCRFP